MNTRLATDRQFETLVKAVNERPGAKVYVDTQLASYRLQHPRQLTVSQMSNVLTVVFDMPKTQAEQSSAEEPQAGVYEDTDGNLFRVYFGQQSGRMLVQQIIAEHDTMGDMQVDYRYLGAAARKLPKDAVRLPLERVGKLGIATGQCLICGRRLDVPESVDRGIGPVCAERY